MPKQNHEAEVSSASPEGDVPIEPGLERGFNAIEDFEARIESLAETLTEVGSTARSPLTREEKVRRQEILDAYHGLSSRQVRDRQVRAIVALKAIKRSQGRGRLD